MKLMVKLLAVFLIMFGSSAMAQVVPLCSRPLPIDNLNNGAGALRSNVAWAFVGDYLVGDSCPMGSLGETWVVRKIVGWSVQGTPDVTEMGDRFKTVQLYLGDDSGLSLAVEGSLSLGSSLNSNPNITHTRVNYANGEDYQGSSGSFIQIWQHDIDNLFFTLPGGGNLHLATYGELQDSVNYYWFTHASNKDLSGNVQEGADDSMDWLALADLSTINTWSSLGNGWDKASDLNYIIWAEKLGDGMATGGGWFVPEAVNSSGITLDGSRATFGFITRNKKGTASGNLEFQYSADGINLHSSSYTWAQISSSIAMFEGTATINNVDGYRFRVSATDGDRLGTGVSDRFEIRIWTDASGSFSSPVHRASGDLGGGNIVVHKK